MKPDASFFQFQTPEMSSLSQRGWQIRLRLDKTGLGARATEGHYHNEATQL